MVAEATVSRAIAAVNEAKAKLDQAYVWAPQNSKALKNHTRLGDLVSNDGVMVGIGQLSRNFLTGQEVKRQKLGDRS